MPYRIQIKNNKGSRSLPLGRALRGLVAFVMAASFLASPALVSADTTTFRPNAAGDYQTWSIFGGSATRWQATSDQNDSTGVQITADTSSREIENLQDASQTGLINSVTAYMRAKATGQPAQVTYVSAGAGSGVTGNNTYPTPAYPAGLQANDLILLQVTVRNTSNTPTTPAGWTPLYGPDTTGTGRQWIYYRFSNGTETGTITVTVGGNVCKIARMYAFRNVALSSFTEGAGFRTGTVATISAQPVTTTNINRLAVSFVFVNYNDAVGSFTGETGGDWVEAIPEFTTAVDNRGCVQLQTAVMAGAGTISGGLYTMTRADRWGVRAFALIPIDPAEQAVILWRTHSTDYESSAQTISRTAFTNYSETRTTNPNTGSAWTWTEVNALQVGSRASTLGAGETIQCAEYWIVVDYTLCTITAPATVCTNSTGNTASVPDAGVGATYAWTIDNGGIITGGGSTRSITWTAGSTSPITIGITVTKGGSQCINSTQVTVITIDCTVTAPSSVYANSVGNTASVPDAGGGATYAWTVTNGTITAGQGTRSITWRAGTISPVTISITVTVGGCQCVNSVQVTVITPSTLSVSIAGNRSFCEGGSTTLTANAAGGAPPYSYDWSASTAPGSYQDNEYIATGTGTVAVTVTDSAICSTTVVSDNNTMVTQGNVSGATYPHNAALAYVHPSWWGGLTGYNFGYPSNTAQWIWESYYVVHPIEGDRVFFERTFNVPTLPTNATLHITCDNGYEVYMNGFFVGSAQVRPCWLTDNLTDTCVDSGGWQSVETYSVTLQKGSNTLEIKAANEYMESGSGTPESNPGGVVYDLIYQYNCAASDSVEVSVNPRPLASASSNSPVEEGGTILLTGGPDGMSSYSWTGPNGFSNLTQSPSIPNATLSMAGEYILTVTNSYNCEDDSSVVVTVNPASIPTVAEIEIYEDPGCTTIANSMTPQSIYYARLSATLSNNLEHLQTVQVTLFYNGSGSDNMTAPTSGNTQTCAILTCAVGPPPNWTLSSGSSTSWTIETIECIQPPLNTTSGAWIFAFRPGKVATENTGIADWDVQGKAIRNPSQTGELYVRNKDMNWYGEISVNTPSVDWGEVPLGLTPDNTTYNPKIISIHYIANGNYYEDIRSEDWMGGGESVTLDETGINPPAFPGMFALKADDTSNLGSAITVTRSTYNHTNDTGGLTTEDGVIVNTNSLWLSLSSTGILPETYTGAIYYQIAKR